MRPLNQTTPLPVPSHVLNQSNPSHTQVRYLRISEQHKSYNPYRWVRYVTQASSYVCRV